MILNCAFHDNRAMLNYAELKDVLRRCDTRLIGTPGSVTIRNTTTGSFFYRQYYDQDGKKKDQYIGPTSSDDGRMRAEKMRESITLERGLRKIASLCCKSGMIFVSQETLDRTSKLRDEFNSGLVLVGLNSLCATINGIGLDLSFATKFHSSLTSDVNQFISTKFAHAFLPGAQPVDPAIAAYLTANSEESVLIAPKTALMIRVPSSIKLMLYEVYLRKVEGCDTRDKDDRKIMVESLFSYFYRFKSMELESEINALPDSMRPFVLDAIAAHSTPRVEQ